MNCKSCGTPLLDDDKFCPNCGVAVNGEIDPNSGRPDTIENHKEIANDEHPYQDINSDNNNASDTTDFTQVPYQPQKPNLDVEYNPQYGPRLNKKKSSAGFIVGIILSIIVFLVIVSQAACIALRYLSPSKGLAPNKTGGYHTEYSYSYTTTNGNETYSHTYVEENGNVIKNEVIEEPKTSNTTSTPAASTSESEDTIKKINSNNKYDNITYTVPANSVTYSSTANAKTYIVNEITFQTMVDKGQLSDIRKNINDTFSNFYKIDESSTTVNNHKYDVYTLTFSNSSFSSSYSGKSSKITYYATNVSDDNCYCVVTIGDPKESDLESFLSYTYSMTDK